jgi:hypothetical protein
MSSEYIPVAIRRIVEARSENYCEYCYSPEAYATERFVIEHIFPRAAGGLSILNNLAWDNTLWTSNGFGTSAQSFWGCEFTIVAGSGKESST